VTEARPLRVLVVDDSVVQRQILARLLTQDPGIELAGQAANGAEAVRAVARLRPDVVTLDDRMPMMSGIEAARHIMRETPTPIVMISAASGEDARKLTQEALASGVLAVQGKRALSSAEPGAVAQLVRLVKGMATVRVVRRRREPLAREHAVPAAAANNSPLISPEVVVIGASTGGPNALRQILGDLPASFPLPILVVQHTTVGYSRTLVEWLTGMVELPVRVAENGPRLDAGGVFVAPTGRHLIVDQARRLVLLEGPPVSLHCPSVNVLFKSVAEVFGNRAAGVLLTGMGDDGAAGLLELKRAGALTVAQDEASSVVFGMPAEAIRLGAVDRILPPEQIAAALLEAVARETPTWS